MLERIREGSDGLAAVYPAMLNCMIALRSLGYSKTNPVYAKVEKDFAGLFVDDPDDFRIQPCLSPVWDTAITIISLADSGLSPEHPALQKAAEWLVNKEVRIRGDWAVNNSYPEASGWAFEYNNVYYADTDDTAMVLMALRLVQPGDSQSLNDLFRRALGWQLSFQCRDGGWAAFDKNVTTPWLEDMPFADHNAILDPTCSDLTARTLELLGYIGFDRNAKCVRDAIEYLVATQGDDGSWYGRWGVNYIYGTWQVLRGLRAISEDMTQDWIYADAIGSRAAKTMTAAGVRPVAPTKIHRPKELAQALRRKPLGRSWASAPAATWIGRAFNVACVTFFARKSPTAPGMKMKSRAPVSRAPFI